MSESIARKSRDLQWRRRIRFFRVFRGSNTAWTTFVSIRVHSCPFVSIRVHSWFSLFPLPSFFVPFVFFVVAPAFDIRVHSCPFVSIRGSNNSCPFVVLNSFRVFRAHSWFCFFFSCISCVSWFNPFAPIRGSSTSFSEKFSRKCWRRLVFRGFVPTITVGD